MNSALNLQIQIAGRQEQLAAIRAELKDPRYSADDKKILRTREKQTLRILANLINKVACS